MKRWLVVGAIGLFGLLLLGVYFLTRPPRIELPKRDYPPDNAFESLLAIGARVFNATNRDERFKQLMDGEAFWGHKPVILDTDDYNHFVQNYQPFIEEYTPLLSRPCVAVYDYERTLGGSPPSHSKPTLGHLLYLVLIESALMRYELQNGREENAVQRFGRLMRLTYQTSNEGNLFALDWRQDYSEIAMEPFLSFSPQKPETLEQVIRICQEYLEQTPPLHELLEQERYIGYGYLNALSRASWTEFSNAFPFNDMKLHERLRIKLTLRSAYQDLNRQYENLLSLAHKPSWERDYTKLPPPSHPLLNHLSSPLTVNLLVFKWDTYHVTRVRLLGVLSAVRLYHQRTGRYPERLEDLHLGEMIIDPFTGKPFIYRVDPVKGFQLYSAGEDKQDNGGIFHGDPRRVRSGSEDISPIPLYQAGSGSRAWFR